MKKKEKKKETKINQEKATLSKYERDSFKSNDILIFLHLFFYFKRIEFSYYTRKFIESLNTNFPIQILKKTNEL